jgi:hypothetical protein
LSEIKKALAERMLKAELDQHLEGEAASDITPDFCSHLELE